MGTLGPSLGKLFLVTFSVALGRREHPPIDPSENRNLGTFQTRDAYKD